MKTSKTFKKLLAAVLSGTMICQTGFARCETPSKPSQTKKVILETLVDISEITLIAVATSTTAIVTNQLIKKNDEISKLKAELPKKMYLENQLELLQKESDDMKKEKISREEEIDKLKSEIKNLKSQNKNIPDEIKNYALYNLAVKCINLSESSPEMRKHFEELKKYYRDHKITVERIFKILKMLYTHKICTLSQEHIFKILDMQQQKTTPPQTRNSIRQLISKIVNLLDGSSELELTDLQRNILHNNIVTFANSKISR